MKKIHVDEFFSDDFSLGWKQNMLQGIVFTVFGVMVLFFPQLLVAFAAVLFIVIGFSGIITAVVMRQRNSRYEELRKGCIDIS